MQKEKPHFPTLHPTLLLNKGDTSISVTDLGLGAAGRGRRGSNIEGHSNTGVYWGWAGGQGGKGNTRLLSSCWDFSVDEDSSRGKSSFSLPSLLKEQCQEEPRRVHFRLSQEHSQCGRGRIFLLVVGTGNRNKGKELTAMTQKLGLRNLVPSKSCWMLTLISPSQHRLVVRKDGSCTPAIYGGP